MTLCCQPEGTIRCHGWKTDAFWGLLSLLWIPVSNAFCLICLLRMKKWQHAARDQHEFSSQGFVLSKHRFFVQHPAVGTWIRKEQHRNHFSRNSGNFSYLNFVRFRALTLGDICFEQNCKKVQDLVDELCDFEASKWSEGGHSLLFQDGFWTFRMVSVEWFQQLFHQFCSRIVGTNFVRFRALYLFHSFDELQVCNPTFPENSWNLEINDC